MYIYYISSDELRFQRNSILTGIAARGIQVSRRLLCHARELYGL